MLTAVDRANMSLRNGAYKQTKEGKNWMKIRCAAESRREKLEKFRSAVRNEMCAWSNSTHSLRRYISCLDLCESRDGQWIFIVVSQRHMLSRHLTFASFYSKNLQTSIFLLLGGRSLWAFFCKSPASLRQSSFNYFIDCGWWIVTIGIARFRGVDNWDFTFSSSINYRSDETEWKLWTVVSCAVQQLVESRDLPRNRIAKDLFLLDFGD